MKRVYLTSVIYVLIFVLATVDTHLFVYPSLSQSLLPGILTALTGLFVFLKKLTSSSPRHLSCSFLLITTWMLYVVLHHAFIPSETYRTYYYLSGMILCLATATLVENGNLKWKTLENSLVLIGFFHSIAICIQLFHHNDSVYSIMGCTDNPTVAALFLTCCSAIVIQRIKERRYVYSITTLLFIACIILLKCRTAYAGLLVIVAVHLFRTEMIQRKKAMFVVASIIASFVVGSRMYHFKQASSEGRILIWKITTGIIAEKPQGYGYGMFEKYYNLAQADYFFPVAQKKKDCWPTMFTCHTMICWNRLLKAVSLAACFF